MGTQMKFVYLALIAGASAIKLHQKPAHLAHAPATSNLVKIASHLKNKIAKHEACPSPEEKEEVEAWFAEVMADGVLTKEEGAAGLQAAADHAGHQINGLRLRLSSTLLTPTMMVAWIWMSSWPSLQ